MATTPSPSFWSNLSDMLGNPNTQNFMFRLGAELDPKGAGGMIGRAGLATNRDIRYQDLTAKMLAGGEAERKELREMNRKLLERMGPITPRGTEGLNGAKETKSGALELDVDTGDPYKLAADLGGMTIEGTPGVNSIARTKEGSYLFNVDAPEVREPMSLADELDDFAPGNLFNPRAQQRLSYTPVNQDQRLAEMADLFQNAPAPTNLPPQVLASMRTPTVPQIQYAAGPSQQKADINSLLPSTGGPTEAPNEENLLPRRLVRRRRSA